MTQFSVRRALGLGGIAILLLGISARTTIHGLALVIRAAELDGAVRRVADLTTTTVTARRIRVPAGDVMLNARVYAPPGRARQTVLLVSGLHPAGIDEPRLITLATRLAEANVTVMTPEIPELSRLEITPVLTDRIEAAAVWLASQPALAPTGRIGLMGISFSGGLAVVAAGRPALRDRLLYVFSFGGHDDLPRVLGYLCAWCAPGATPTAAPPHDYGVALVLLTVAEDVVPPEQVGPLRDAVRRFVSASYLDRAERPRAAREFAALREVARTLPEPSATLLGYVNDRDVVRLGPWLLPHIGRYAEAAALSPSRSPAPAAPVYLLHGRDDNVIPASESERLATRLRDRGTVRLLLTDLISHAEADRPAHFVDVLRLGRFWGDLLAR